MCEHTIDLGGLEDMVYRVTVKLGHTYSNNLTHGGVQAQVYYSDNFVYGVIHGVDILQGKMDSRSFKCLIIE